MTGCANDANAQKHQYRPGADVRTGDARRDLDGVRTRNGSERFESKRIRFGEAVSAHRRESSGSILRAEIDSLDAGDANRSRPDLGDVLEHEVADNTKKNYAAQWRMFVSWALRNGSKPFPAGPTEVAVYLAERLERRGHRPATLRAAAAAISYVHQTARVEDPCADPTVRKTLRSATRKTGSFQRQAEALTMSALNRIREIARRPRRGRGGRLESPAAARRRGDLDVAVIGLMRDGMLRVSEAAAIRWDDLSTEQDGTGRLQIRRSKTDQEGETTVLYVSAETMAAVEVLRKDACPDDPVFGLGPNQISARIIRAAAAAGLGDGFSGHSPREGMARDLARAGTELPRLMTAGRWRSPRMADR